LSFQIAQAVPDLDFLNALLRQRSETVRLKDSTTIWDRICPAKDLGAHEGTGSERTASGTSRQDWDEPLETVGEEKRCEAHRHSRFRPVCTEACWPGSRSAGVAPRPRQSLYDQEIRPYEKKIVWYRLAEKLPEIAPVEDAKGPRPLRSRNRSNQTIVAGRRTIRIPMRWSGRRSRRRPQRRCRLPGDLPTW
jgi:hypothetical protein